MIELRHYQVTAIEAIREKIREGFRYILFVLFTGGGKTLVAAYIMWGALKKGSRLLFVAHRRELISQAYEKMLAMGVPEENLGVIMGNGRITLKSGRQVRAARPGAQIQIASIDTLRHRHKPEADIVFIDETHRALSPSYMALRDHYKEAIFIGLTATPFRMGGKSLGKFYDTIVVGAYPSLLIAEGWIVKPRVWTVDTEKLPDLSGVSTRNGDYKEEELEQVCNTGKLVGSIVDHWIERAGGRRTVCFPVNVAHSRRIVDDFLSKGIPAEHLDGETPKDLRAAILARLETGETLVVCSVGVLCEGFDQPSVKCAILARPTMSTGLVIQQAGRILRPWNGVDAIILDHAGCIPAHGMPTWDREPSLEDRQRRRSEFGIRTCKECLAIFESTLDECPECGKPFVPPERDVGERKVEHVDGKLVEYNEPLEDEKRAYWDEMCRTASENGFQSGWVYHRFRERYGHKPPNSYPRPVGRPMTPGELDVMRAKLERVARERGLPGKWVQEKITAVVQPELPAVVQPELPAVVPDEPVIEKQPSPVLELGETGVWDV